MSRVCIIGDVHGCIEELQELYALIPSGTDIVFAGDLVDRGPESAEVVKFVRLSGARCVMGNHDFKHQRYHRRVALALEQGKPIPDSKEEIVSVSKALSAEDKAWMGELPYYIQLPDHNAIVVHAGVTPHHRFFPTMEEIKTYVAKKRAKYEMLFFVRYVDVDGFMVGNVFSKRDDLFHWTDVYDGFLGHIYYGHEPYMQSEPVRSEYASGIDLACCFGGKLCGVILEDGREVDILTVDAQRAYADLKRSSETEE